MQPLPEYSKEHGFHSALWRHNNLPRSALSILFPPMLRHLTINFSVDDVHPINWLPNANLPYDQLYAQMFKTKDLTDALALQQVQDGMLPIQLRFNRITLMDIMVSRTMLPTQMDMWSVLTSLVTLKVVMCELICSANILYVCLTYPCCRQEKSTVLV